MTTTRETVYVPPTVGITNTVQGLKLHPLRIPLTATKTGETYAGDPEKLVYVAENKEIGWYIGDDQENGVRYVREYRGQKEMFGIAINTIIVKALPDQITSKILSKRLKFAPLEWGVSDVPKMPICPGGALEVTIEYTVPFKDGKIMTFVETYLEDFDEEEYEVWGKGAKQTQTKEIVSSVQKEIPETTTTDQTSVESSTPDQTNVESPTTDQTSVESPTTDQTSVESSTTDQTSVESSATDQTSVESSTTDQTSVDRFGGTTFERISSKLSIPEFKSLISEFELYKLAMRSVKPDAVAFQDWVCTEVLPAIRKTGAYLTEKTAEDWLNDPDIMIRAMEEIKKQRAIAASSTTDQTSVESTPLLGKEIRTRWDRSAIAKRTWEVARELAAKTGVSARSCYGSACRQAWEEEASKYVVPRKVKARKSTKKANWDRSAIVMRAWEVARELAAKTGVSARSCYGDACRQAWNEAKEEAGQSPRATTMYSTPLAL